MGFPTLYAWNPSLQVAQFHRKVVRRLAAEKRAAEPCARGGKTINARIGSIDSFANVLESSGFTLEEEQGMPREHALPSEEVSDSRMMGPRAQACLLTLEILRRGVAVTSCG